MKCKKHARQGFLGSKAQGVIESARIGVIGLGGGGSHIVQQLAHIGFQNYVIADPDKVELSNLNRLVGATLRDSKRKTPKVEVAQRVIRGLEPTATIDPHRKRWQDVADSIKACDIIFGCLDGFAQRRQLEAHTRRFMIPYIDIGMDVYHPVAAEAPCMSGQVILSMPGRPCMRCLGFITDENLRKEAERYGDAGDRPQVVWPNGILASTAVGICLNLLTGWTQDKDPILYHCYEGNRGILTPHVRLKYRIPAECDHYPVANTGDPVFVRA